VHKNTWGDLADPVSNARAAYEISQHGTDMRPWTTTHASHSGTTTDYRTYLDDVSAVTGYAGDGRGVEGYGSPLPDPLPASQPTTMTPSSDPAAELGRPLVTDPANRYDTDQDGLTDAFERMVGSSVDRADSDQDGLSDAYETVVSRTDTLLADTDQDTLTDSSEVALGTSGSVWDTDSDGASDGVEVQLGKDPLLAEQGAVPQPEVETVPPTPDTTPVSSGTTSATLADAFVEVALRQAGDEYEFGAATSLTDSDPEVFDCSSLTMWAARQVGVEIQDGTWNQYLDLKSQGRTMSVEEALHTKGALLFYFSDEPTPGSGRPAQAHVAISLGDGRTIEAQSSEADVGVFQAGGRFNFAGMIPEMAGLAPAGTTPLGVDGLDTLGATVPDDASLLDPDADDDGLSDLFEEMVGLDPMSADSDDDGRSDAEEQLGTSVRLTDAEVTTALAEQGLEAIADADADGLSNRYEVRHGFDAHVADTDADGVTDSSEVALGTDATRLDTDADGVTDGAELDFGTDPLTAGGLADGWGADLAGGAGGGLPDGAGVEPFGEPIGAMDDAADLG
jgi:cell wall-associated NlpC family hydrolase